MALVCYIDHREDTPAPPFIQESLLELGHEVVTVFVSESRLQWERKLSDSSIDLFIAIHDVGFLAANILTEDVFQKIPKALLIYDDPIKSYQLFGKRHPFVGEPKQHAVQFFIWDGYWRKKMEHLGWRSFATHLAAEPSRFYPNQAPAIPQIADKVVFLGNIPSQQSLVERFDGLPPVYRRLGSELKQRISGGVYGQNPFEILDQVIVTADERDRREYEVNLENYLEREPDLQQPLAPHILLRQLAWLLGKRETRLRALRVASSVAPLAILSHQKLAGVAGREDLMAEIKARGNQTVFVDTSQAAYPHLGHLYRSGKLQIQTTDPQSVEGGVPYRVFQCSACAVPLISDYKRELGECFESGSEILFYHTEEELAERIRQSISDEDAAQARGQNAYRRFLQEHTWKHRMESILNLCLKK